MKRSIRRALAVGLSLGLCGTLLSGAIPPTWQAHAAGIQGREEHIGHVPSYTPSVPNFGTTISPDGTPVAIVVSGGDGGILNVIDLRSRQLILQRRFTEAGTDVQAWGFATLPDGKVLVATNNAQLYEVDPASSGTNPEDSYRVTLLSTDEATGYREISGSLDSFWDMTADEHGRVYIAAKRRENGGQVISYDRNAATKWSALGDPTGGALQAIAYENGNVYAAAHLKGTPTLHRIATSGQDRGTNLPVPAEITGQGAVIERLEAHGGRLYAGASRGGNGAAGAPPCGGTCVLDPGTGSVTGTLPTWSSRVITRPGEPSKVYYYQELSPGDEPGFPGRGRLMEHDPATGASEKLFELEGMGNRLSPNSWASGEVFASAAMNADRLTVYDASKAQAANLPAGTIASSPRKIQRMTAAPGGQLYASWYMTAPELLRITPAASAEGFQFSELQLPFPMQPEGIGASEEWLVAGTYPGGNIVASSLKTGETKPADTIGDGQNRPYAVTPIGGSLFAIGSVPGAGTSGGAITLYDAANGSKRVFPLETLDNDPGLPADALQGLSPISIAHRDGKLYVGTTIRGDTINVRARNTPKVFEFDIASGKATRITSLPGQPDETNEDTQQKAVSALVFGDDGVLYGTTGSHMLSINPATLTIERNEQLRRGGYPGINASQLVYRDGVLYGVMADRLHAIRADDFSNHQILVDPRTDLRGSAVEHLVLSEDGSLFYIRGTGLYRYRIQS